jgi:hypothetical protein
MKVHYTDLCALILRRNSQLKCSYFPCHFFLMLSLHYHLKTYGYYIYHTPLNTLKLCILSTHCICVFRMVLTINSDCFPKQH